MSNMTHKRDDKELIYKFERKIVGHKTVSHNDFGPYLYRNIITNSLFASWYEPTNDINKLYKCEDIGYNKTG